MSTTGHFKHADSVIETLKRVQPYVWNDYNTPVTFTGMVVTAAVTSYEIEVKGSLFRFADKHGAYLSSFAHRQWDKINGRIRIDELANYLAYFDEDFKKEFKQQLNSLEESTLRRSGTSIKAQYQQILTNRHQYVHSGSSSVMQMTFEEAINDYEQGKEVINCFIDYLNSK